MLTRDEFLAVIEGNSIESWTMAFFNEKLAIELLGRDCIPSDFLPGDEFCFGASPREDWEKKANYAERADMPAVPVGFGAGLAFGHGGPGEFREKRVSFSENRRVTVYETGVYKEVRYNPHFYHHYKYPLETPGDIDQIDLPDPRDPERYRLLREEVNYHKEKDRITFTNVNGFFSGVHYFLYPYEELLIDLLRRPAEVERLVDTLGAYNIEVARKILEAGVDVLCFCDDLGSRESLLMSPELFRRFFRGWHARLADICHAHGAFIHMHSHGNIRPILEDLIDIHIDLINPVDPSEGMDIEELSERYGKKVTFVGGISKFFFEWDRNSQRRYLNDLYSGLRGCGAFIMDSGGIPEKVKREDWEFFRDIKKELSEKY